MRQDSGVPMRIPLSALALVAVTAATASMPAEAVLASRFRVETAARVCQGALPQFAGTLRARPLAIRNEGTEMAYVSCGWETSINGSQPVTSVGLRLTNPTATPVYASCTMVHGWFAAPTAVVYFPRTVLLDPAETENITWSADQLPGGLLTRPSVSCALPPGIELRYLNTLFQSEVGLR